MLDRSPTTATASFRLTALRVSANIILAVGLYLTGAGVLGDFVSREEEKLFHDPRGYHDYVAHFPFEEYSRYGSELIFVGIVLLFVARKSGDKEEVEDLSGSEKTAL